MTKIAVIGSLLVDLSMRTPRVPQRGENLQVAEYKMGAGGKGANAAAAITRMGGEALIIGCVGDDHLGRLEISALEAEGVDTAGVTRVPGRPTDLAVLMVHESGENAVLAVTSTNHLLTEQAVASALCPQWGSLDAILVNFECSRGAVATAVRSAKEHHIPVVVDAGPIRGYGPETWRDATVLSPNIDEAAALAGVAATSIREDDTVRRVAQELLAAGPAAVLVKRGEKGALLVTRQEAVRIPAFLVEVVDSSGAGDAFTAALTLALAERTPLQKAARFACAAGALAATQFGTLEAMPTLAAVNKLLSG